MSQAERKRRSSKLTYVMVLLALGFGGLAYFEFQGSKEDEVRQAREAQLIGWGEKKLKSASLKKGDKLLRIEKRGEDWYVTSPLEDYADQFNANSWVGDIATEKASKLEGVKTQSDGSVFWAEYGLDKDLTVVELESEDGKKATIQFAKNNAFDGSFYIRYGEAVYLGVRPWAGVLAKKLDSLRSKDVFRKKSSLEKIVIKAMGENLSLIKKDEETWEIEGDSEFPFADASLKAFTRQLSGLRIQSFVDDPKELANKRKYGLHKPLGTVIGTMGGQDLSITIGRPVREKKGDKSDKEVTEDKYYAMVSGAKSYYELHPAAAKSLIKTKIDFRDRTLPFQFDLTEARSLSLKTKGSSLDIMKEGATWKLSSSREGKVLKTSELESFLSELKSLAAKDYMQESKRGKYESHVVIRSKDGSELLNFAWKKSEANASVFYGKTNLSDLGFTVMASELSDWTPDRFLGELNKENGSINEKQ